MTSRIIRGDARQTGLPDAFFHCVATSPPYFGLRKYGDDDREIGDEPTPNEYIDEMRKVGREVWRVLRDDGTWWLNLGDSFASGEVGRHDYVTGDKIGATKQAAHGARKHAKRTTGVPPKNLLMIPQRVALALQQDGWIIRAQIPWVKASCMPESVRDRPTVAHEYVFLLAKSQRYFWDADAVRMANAYEDKRKTSWQARKDDGAPMRRGKAIESNEGFTYLGQTPSGRNLRTSDFFNAGLDEYAAHLAHVRENGGLMLSPDGDPLAFRVNPVGNKLAHFAMWPPRLVAPMIKASTSEKGCCPKCGAQWRRVVQKQCADMVARYHRGEPTRHGTSGAAASKASNVGGFSGTSTTLGFSPPCECNAGDPIPCRVLDLFAGSGTTLQVCEALGRDSWGVELMAKNIPLIGERLKAKLDPELMKPTKPRHTKRVHQLERAE